ncbi:MAG: hypothetical protein GY913_03355 [Proteobacteria bacterium]|nr:hypothetical protein [Pseudomonadota bacterium]MCP4915937.1 hypothetical protein [Pseudomonadota bacterium]
MIALLLGAALGQEPETALTSDFLERVPTGQDYLSRLRCTRCATLAVAEATSPELDTLLLRLSALLGSVERGWTVDVRVSGPGPNGCRAVIASAVGPGRLFFRRIPNEVTSHLTGSLLQDLLAHSPWPVERPAASGRLSTRRRDGGTWTRGPGTPMGSFEDANQGSTLPCGSRAGTAG